MPGVRSNSSSQRMRLAAGREEPDADPLHFQRLRPGRGDVAQRLARLPEWMDGLRVSSTRTLLCRRSRRSVSRSSVST